MIKKWNVIRLVKNGKYLRAYVPDHPKANKHGYVLAHRIAVENHLMRRLEDWEIVHHKDENGHNNHPDNLEVMTQSAHRTLHGSTGRAMVKLICSRCRKPFSREENQVTNIKRNHYFCSRACYIGPKKDLCPINVDADVAHL